MSDMIEVTIDSIRVSLVSQQRIIVLREIDAERYLPIWIGIFEAEAITIALQEVEISRPLTHDLLKNILHMFNARVLRVEVTALRETVYYGSIVIEANGSVQSIDSRPSDALALAVRAHVPILISRQVMDDAGIIPDKNLDTDLEAAAFEEKQSSSEPESSPRLSIFEDFLENLDLDSLDENDKPDNTPDTP